MLADCLGGKKGSASTSEHHEAPHPLNLVSAEEDAKLNKIFDDYTGADNDEFMH